MKPALPLLLTLAATSAYADETRSLDAHEHGVGALNIAVEGNTVGMEFTAPGADIVGFEYAAKTAEDRAAIDAAVATLAKPSELFVLPAAAACNLTQASAKLEMEDDHEDHDHDEHAQADDHDHDEHDHDDHAASEASHTEFHATYILNCANPNEITGISFAYFKTFENARELEVQIVTSNGASAFEVFREDPTLDLRGMF